MKQKVIDMAISAKDLGLVMRTWGNVSARVDPDHFVITPSGRDYCNLTEEDIAVVSVQEEKGEKQKRHHGRNQEPVPSSETPVHRAVYQAKPKVNFILHTHQENASALSSARASELEFLIGLKVKNIGYAYPGSQELAKNVARAVDGDSSLEGGKVMLMQYHGALFLGDDAEKIMRLAINVEGAAERYITKICGISIERVMELVKKQEAGVIPMLPPFSEDYAQMLGITGESVVFSPISLSYDREEEIKRALIRKNTKAYLVAQLLGGKPLPPKDADKMHKIYVTHYSKLA